MTWFTSITTSCDGNFRHKRKFHGYLFLACALLLIVVNATPVNAHPKETESGDVIVPLDEALPLSEEYDDVDNIEFHQAKLVDGVLQEEHPVIMYKEDFVSEDFVPKKNRTHRLRKHRDPAHRRRRLNEQAETEKYHPLQPEKIYFDILSSAPIVTSDESKSASSKAHVEVISLAEADSPKMVEGEDEVKRVLNKRPKKYHHRRQRREADESIYHREHLVQKRHQNPYYRVSGVNSIYRVPVYQPIPNQYYLPSYSPVKHYQKKPVQGNYHNGPVNVPPTPKITVGTRFGGPDNTDRVIWRDYTPTRNPNQRANVTVGAPRPLFSRRTTEAPNLATPPEVMQNNQFRDLFLIP
ncbi:uncharacterized protein LOC101459410 isoform X2 [Ceratitis capitata]|uniref:uncharacterized protein LOC101459410 isoform X2 n=1 Tax=Ceratitis capitata TaxID=7213 RepID=UPI000329EDC6|nr:uncharacterized protein LOC101459410 isoform X2 [Ceratitis capitata]